VRATTQIRRHRYRPAAPASGVLDPFSAGIPAEPSSMIVGSCAGVGASDGGPGRCPRRSMRFRFPRCMASRTTLRSEAPSGLAIPYQAHALVRPTGRLRALRQIDPDGGVRRLTGRLVPASDVKALIAPDPQSYRCRVGQRLSRRASGAARRIGIAQGKIRGSTQEARFRVLA
jgi:hypothetical protein